MIFVQIFVACAAAVVMADSIISINRMTSATNHGIRAAHVLIAAGAFGEVAAIFCGHVPGIAETLFIGGFGLLDCIDRRRILRGPVQTAPTDEEVKPCWMQTE